MQTSSSKRQAFQRILQRRPSGKLLIVLLAGGLIGIFGLQQWLRSRQFEAAMQAYQSGDCQRAIAGFKSFDGNSEVKKIRQQCRDYEAINPAIQKPFDALGRAAKFVQAHAPHNPYINDSKADNPLMPGLRNRFNGHLKLDRMKEWLSVDVCKRLEPIEKADLLPQPDRSLPQLYQQCGNYLISIQQTNAGMATFEMTPKFRTGN